MNDYEDIINLNRPKSKYPKMDIKKRSAQFASFDALDGYNEKVEEVSKIKELKKELSDSEKEVINEKLNYLNNNITKNIKINVCYYDYNLNKYVNITDILTKIDSYKKILIFQNKEIININDIDNIVILKK